MFDDLLENSWLLFFLSILPGLVISGYFYWADRYEKEPLRLLLQSFFYGVLSAFAVLFIAAIFGFEDKGETLDTLYYAFIPVAMIEESSKFFFFYLVAFNNAEFNEPFDGIIYSVMVAMGFATFENLLYVFDSGFQTAVVRMFTAVPAHASFGVMIGFFAGIAKFKTKYKTFLLSIGWLSAVILHGSYDFFLMVRNYEWMFLGAVISLILAIYLSRKAISSHQENSPFKPN